MTPEVVPLPLVTFCWNRIGVKGDRSCPELPKVIHCRNCPVFAEAGEHLYDRPPPAGYSDEWANRIAGPGQSVGGRTLPVVVFRVGSEWLALDVGLAVEVAPVRTIRRVPHQTDEVLVGLVNIRGELQLAVSLQRLLGSEGPAGGAAGFSVIVRRALAAGQQGPADVDGLRVLLAQRGHTGLGLGTVGAGLDTGQEAALLDQGFGATGLKQGIHAKKLRRAESKVRARRL